MERNYHNGKIYCIRNNIDDDMYVGCTTQSLSRRMSKHRGDINCRSKETKTLYTKMRELGKEAFYIELIEEFKCDNIEQLRQREGEVIRQMGTLNTRIECRTTKEWREDNKDQLIERAKQYYEDNKDKICERRKNYYEEHKDQIKEQNKIYREEHKDQLNQRAKQYREEHKDHLKEQKQQPFECDCGSVVSKGHKSRHLKSIKHQEFINQEN